MLTLQLFIKGRWHDAAQLNIQHPHQGRESPALLAYNFDYAVDYLDRKDYASCSLNYPVMLIGSYAARPWFTFLDDIMPAGASNVTGFSSLDYRENLPLSRISGC